MSDDLISRKAVLHILYDIKDDDNVPKNYGTVLDIIRKIRKLPTAFDKEKVIEELRGQIQERLQVDSVVVLNVIPLSEDDKPETTDSRRLREREEFFKGEQG